MRVMLEVALNSLRLVCNENLVQFDFRSLYPSLIISKNISPDVLYHEDDSFDSLADDEIDMRIILFLQNIIICLKSLLKVSILLAIGNVLDERTRIKTAMKKSTDYTEKMMLDVQQQALKRLANTMYGVYGYSRFDGILLSVLKLLLLGVVRILRML